LLDFQRHDKDEYFGDDISENFIIPSSETKFSEHEEKKGIIIKFSEISALKKIIFVVSLKIKQ